MAQIWVYQGLHETAAEDAEGCLSRRQHQALLQKLMAAWDFYREVAALGYYWLRGWLC